MRIENQYIDISRLEVSHQLLDPVSTAFYASLWIRRDYAMKKLNGVLLLLIAFESESFDIAS